MNKPNIKVALVTGGAQGLGRAIAARLAQSGCSLCIADLHDQQLHQSANELRATGHLAYPLMLDVTDEAAVVRAYAEIDARFGRLDILINNAGVPGQRVPVENLSLSAWEATLRTNLTSAFLMSRAAIPVMRRHRWGRIVNISSVVARGRPGAKRSDYAASKLGIVGLSRALADEVGRDGITVNCVAPSRIRTAMTLATGGGDEEYFMRGAAATAVGRLGEPADIAHAVGWLCSEEASFVTGTVIDVSGGTVMQ